MTNDGFATATTTAVGHRSEPAPARVWMWLGVLIVLIVLARWRTYYEPLSCDLTTYALVADNLLHGGSLYVDAWDHKPPAVAVTYAAAQLVTGMGPGAVFLLNVTFAVATLLGVYAALRRFSGSAYAGLFAAALWVPASILPTFEANQPNTESFINAALVWMWVLFLPSIDRPLRGLQWLAIGVLVFVATTYKHVAITPWFGLAAAYMLLRMPGVPSMRRRALQGAAVVALVAVGWIAISAWFWLRGHWHQYYDTLFVFNRQYAAVGNATPGTVRRASSMLLLGTAVGSALLMLGWSSRIPGTERWRRLRVLTIGTLLGTQLAISLPGMGFSHYYQLWLPWYCMIPALAWACLRQTVPAVPDRAWLPIAFGPAVVVILLGAGYFRMSADQWSVRKYGPRYVLAYREAALVQQVLKPEERMFVWGSDTALYYCTQRRPVTRLFYMYPIILMSPPTPISTALGAEMRQQLQAAPPDLVLILRKDHDVLQDAVLPLVGIRDWIFSSYVEVTPFDQPGPYQWLARKDGDLQKRLANGPARHR